jgi:hypothetical protein
METSVSLLGRLAGVPTDADHFGGPKVSCGARAEETFGPSRWHGQETVPQRGGRVRATQRNAIHFRP